MNASTQETELVLEWKYNDDDHTEVQLLFLDHMQQVTPIDKFDEKGTYDNMKREINLWQETTETSSVGSNLGHYKILFVLIDKSLLAEEQKEFWAIQWAIAQCDLNLINYDT